MSRLGLLWSGVPSAAPVHLARFNGRRSAGCQPASVSTRTLGIPSRGMARWSTGRFNFWRQAEGVPAFLSYPERAIDRGVGVLAKKGAGSGIGECGMEQAMFLTARSRSTTLEWVPVTPFAPTQKHTARPCRRPIAATCAGTSSSSSRSLAEQIPRPQIALVVPAQVPSSARGRPSNASPMTNGLHDWSPPITLGDHMPREGPRRPPHLTRSTRVRVRLRPPDAARLKAAASATGKPLATYIALAALQHPLPRAVPEVNRKAYAELARVAANLNQWMHAINAGQLPTVDKPMIARAIVQMRELRAALLGRDSQDR